MTTPEKPGGGERDPLLFALFNEIGIIDQLARNRFERALPDGLRVSHFAVLNHLVRLGDGRSPIELARAFQVVKGAMTNTLQRLEARGLIEVRPDPRDRRGKRVYLTAAGRRMRETAVAAVVPLFADLEQAIPDDEIGRLLPLLRRLRARLDRARDGGGAGHQSDAPEDRAAAPRDGVDSPPTGVPVASRRVST